MCVYQCLYTAAIPLFIRPVGKQLVDYKSEKCFISYDNPHITHACAFDFNDSEILFNKWLPHLMSY